jgi:hypothetical protein
MPETKGANAVAVSRLISISIGALFALMLIVVTISLFSTTQPARNIHTPAAASN